MPANHNIFRVIHSLKNPLSWRLYSIQPKVTGEVHFTSELPQDLQCATIVESSELPDWVKLCGHSSPVISSSDDDDFVLPKVAEWADIQKLSDCTDRHPNITRKVAADSTIDRICNVLRGRFKSQETVIKAINASCSDVSLSEGLVEKILKRFSNDWISAFGFFNWAKTQTNYSLSVNSYNVMVDILGKSKNFGLMWEIVEEMRGLGGGVGIVSMVTLTHMMRRLAGARMWDDAILVFREMEARYRLKRDTSALNILMNALIKGGSIEQAHDVFMEFKEIIHPDVRTFNILIHGFCKVGQFDKAQECMELMKKHEFAPDVVSYTAFVEAYSRVKNFQKVDQILDEMKGNGCSPNAITYTIVMHALGKAKEISEALGIHERMKQNNCTPDVSFYSSLIFILSKSGRYKDARDVFDDMGNQSVKPDVLTYNTMISAACLHSTAEEAFGLLIQMEKESCSPNLETYAPLLKMCCRKRWIKVLNLLLNDMFRKGISLDIGTYTLLVIGLCKSGKLEHACSFFEEAVSKGMVPMDSTCKLLVDKLEQNGSVKAKQQIESLMSTG